MNETTCMPARTSCNLKPSAPSSKKTYVNYRDVKGSTNTNYVPIMIKDFVTEVQNAQSNFIFIYEGNI